MQRTFFQLSQFGIPRNKLLRTLFLFFLPSSRSFLRTKAKQFATMDWTMPVNEMLRDEITKVTCTLIPPGFHGDVRSLRVMQDSLSRVIDALGEQSAAAQGLNKVITTADKLRNSPTHTLYLLKDAAAKGGEGEVIGLLKVGRKHLFLFDEMARVCEVEPLCVLDFFVLRDRQRHGHGRVLFDHMLQDQQTTAEKLAVDGPSAKMEQFLRKNYGVERLLRQNNNFAVSPSFFGNTQEISKSGHSTASTPTGAVGRFAAPKPLSAIATVIHGGGSYYQETNNGRAESPTEEAAPSPPAEPTPAPSPAPSPSPEPVPEVKPSLERPSTLHVETTELPAPSPAPPSHSVSPAGSTISRRDSQLTDKGYFDVKFYHNKLW